MSVPDLDPQIVEVLRKARGGRRAAGRGAHARGERARTTSRPARSSSAPVDEVHSVEDRDADGVPVRIYRPVETTEPSAALVYFHGGGCVVGSIDTHDGIARALAQRAPVRRHLGRLPARARAPVPGGARGLLDGGELGDRERRRARDRRRTDRRRRRQRRRRASRRSSRGKGRDARHAVRGAAPDLPVDDRRPGTPSYSILRARATA